MATNPNNNAKIMDLIREAAASSSPPPQGDRGFTDEDVVLFARGELSEIEPLQQKQLVAAIGRDAELASVVVALRHRIAEQPADGPYRFAPAPAWVSHGWKIAAILTLSLGVWRLADPPSPGGPVDGPIQRGLPSTPHDPPASGVVRDVILVVAASASVGLLIPWWWSRRRKKNQT